MSETSYSKNLDQVIAEQGRWIGDAIAILDVEGGDPLTKALEVRDDAESLGISSEKEKQLREVAMRFGIGAEYDLPSAADIDVLEGGKVWKIESEMAISTGRQIVAGSPNRIIGQDEVGHIHSRYALDASGWTEYDMGIFVAKKQDGFVEEMGADTGFGYDIKNGFELVRRDTGQLVRIGTHNGKPVHALRVDRENYVDEEGNNKYRNQPDGAELMRFISDVLSVGGDESSSIGFNTSNTYASRALDVMRAGVLKGRPFRVGMYGRGTIKRIAQDRVPAGTPLNQIPGELSTIAIKLRKLDEALRGDSA